MLAELLKVQVVRLASFQNRCNDVRRKECTPENLPNITFRQSRLSRQRSHVERLSLNHIFIPAVGTREGFYQREFRMSDRGALFLLDSVSKGNIAVIFRLVAIPAGLAVLIGILGWAVPRRWKETVIFWRTDKIAFPQAAPLA
jgi:hypothetical protein